MMDFIGDKYWEKTFIDKDLLLIYEGLASFKQVFGHCDIPANGEIADPEEMKPEDIARLMAIMEQFNGPYRSDPMLQWRIMAFKRMALEVHSLRKMYAAGKIPPAAIKEFEKLGFDWQLDLTLSYYDELTSR